MKSLSEFYRMAGMRDGHRNECKACSLAECKACSLAEKAARHRANPEPARERTRRWQRENPERYAAKQAEFRSSGRKKISDRKSHLKRKFGITLEQYDAMLAEQGGGCGICRKPPRDDISLHVDHDHETGRIRGLLCFTCNNALGDFDDDASLLRSAIRYVEQPIVDELAELTRRRARALVGRTG
jgi:hypothetical protein